VRVAEKITPVLAATSAVATLACCLPIGGASALGLGTALAALGGYQAWFLPIAGLLLAIGGAQVWRTRRVCHTTSWISIMVLALSAVVVIVVWLAPQTVAGLLTDALS
jgi:hypothetical protein